MDGLLLLLTEWWWIAPAAAGGGAVVAVSTRGVRRRGRDRGLEVAAARHELRTAQRAVAVARAKVESAKADLLSAKAARGSTAEARRELSDARRGLRAAHADVRARRSRVTAARVALGAIPRHDEGAYPLARQKAEHDAIVARWMEYETDVAKQIAFPVMSDARHPQVVVFLDANREAFAIRRELDGKRVDPAVFVAYRTAVVRVAETFTAAEKEAWRVARAEERATRVRRVVEPVTRLVQRPTDGSVPKNAEHEHTGSTTGIEADADGERPGTEESHRAPAVPRNVWPVPSRSRHR